MHNRRYPSLPPPLTFPSFFHGKTSGVMFLFHATTSLGLLLFLLHLSSFLLSKLVTSLFHKAISKGNVQLKNVQEEHKNESSEVVITTKKEDLVADIVLGGEALLFLYEESGNNDTLLNDQGKDSKEPISFEEEVTLVVESACGSPVEDLAEEKVGTEYSDVPINDVLGPSHCPSPIISLHESVAFENRTTENKIIENNEDKKVLEDDVKLLEVENSHFVSGKIHDEGVHENKENFGGSLTGDSTSKSSIEWRSSTIFRDSETEYPFSSSSRRSSSHWENYTVFRKYDEEMLFFDRISAQKLSETESLRSIKVQPRSISERIVRKLSSKPKNYTRRARDPYRELESAYVAQICLTWEALNCNYNMFKRKNPNRDTNGSGCPAQIAQQFQQFLVLLQRFIETEPYEYGRRPEIYARIRISSPKLLQVPEFRDSEADDEGKEDMGSKISSADFLVILDDAIRTFMNFLEADRENYCQKFRTFIKKNVSSADPIYLRILKKNNKRKKMRLKEIGRRHSCALRKRKLKEEEEMEILMALIDMKIVSRVLRMADISEEQLHWCEEKMAKVRVWDGKMHRDSSPLFFPVH